jgi:peptide-methionine (R)-S-oxide reductase
MKTKYNKENYWKDKLSPEEFEVTRKGGTEKPFTGKYLNNKDDGVYTCVCCGSKLFNSNKKYNSNSGWPSFTEPHEENSIISLVDRSHFMVRTEVQCQNCEAHLGHVFPDGPGKDGLRYCINSISLNFLKMKK